jgi:hypothetical protein
VRKNIEKSGVIINISMSNRRKVLFLEKKKDWSNVKNMLIKNHAGIEKAAVNAKTSIFCFSEKVVEVALSAYIKNIKDEINIDESDFSYLLNKFFIIFIYTYYTG